MCLSACVSRVIIAHARSLQQPKTHKRRKILGPCKRFIGYLAKAIFWLLSFFFIHRHCLKKEKNLKKWPFPSRRAWNEWSRRVHPRRVIWTRFNCHRFLLLLSQPFLKNNQTMANYESTERKFPKWLSFHSSPPPAPPQRKKKCLNIYSTKQLMMMGNDDGVGAFQSRWAAWVMRTTLNPHFSLFLSNLHFFF